MTEQLIRRLFRESGLGELEGPIETVSGGFMHRMYRVSTGQKYYAVKALNPNIMSRPEAISNYDKAEALEEMLEKAGISLVPALVLNGSRRQNIEGRFFYVFDWHEGTVTDWNNITKEQCYQAGSILGQIHSIDSKSVPEAEAEISSVNWDKYISEAAEADSEVSSLLLENRDLLIYAEDELKRAGKCLPPVSCISDGDMDPKNVMWENGRPLLIDLECLDYGNPVSHMYQLALQWAGITTCKFERELFLAFCKGYRLQYDSGFRHYDEIFGLAYNWIEWLEYNVQRAIGAGVDAAERDMGVSEVRNTLNRIRYVKEKEPEIKELLYQLSTTKEENIMESNKADGLLLKHQQGELDDVSFLREFGKAKVVYSTPYGDHKDGSKKLFLLPGPEKTGYNPVFSSSERLCEFYEKVGRKGYMIMEGTFTSVLETTKQINAGKVPVKMGIIIDPGYYDVTVDAKVLDIVIGMTK